eukprot:gnl/TRDRNA2_/TRDRNA2_160958_c0_seq1.p1 gnl/TRDRNA2_/TRDRNA2_160958_c0~~gnl/TRDRNA2_/TRDRNA2_160958_c0_seq1.p1  ORF type:complete len:211 (-),score=30.41 gnl/TRDRNA2_/TRDRNA2_160958_c0_seq1:96-728(-)
MDFCICNRPRQQNRSAKPSERCPHAGKHKSALQYCEEAMGCGGDAHPSAWSQRELRSQCERKLHELECMLMADPVPEVAACKIEGRHRRLLRHLRAENFDVAAAARGIRAHAAAWKKYGMDDFCEEDEFDEAGPMYVCGTDRAGRPTVIARPCTHHPQDAQDSIRAARRCVYTMQRAVERMSPGIEEATYSIHPSVQPNVPSASHVQVCE